MTTVVTNAHVLDCGDAQGFRFQVWATESDVNDTSRVAFGFICRWPMTRIERIDEILSGEAALVTNDWEKPEEPARYLAVEFSGHDAVWAYDDDDLKSLMQQVDSSDTEREEVRVYDLDGDTYFYVQFTATDLINGVTGEVTRLRSVIEPFSEVQK